MSEGMLSKSTLLLLIYEIVKVNDEILQNSEIALGSEFELSSDASDGEDVGGGATEKRLPHGEEQLLGEAVGIPTRQEGAISGGVSNGALLDDANGNLLGDCAAPPSALEPNGAGKDSSTHPPRSAKEKQLANVLSGKLKGMGKHIGRKLIERVLIYKNDFSDPKDIAKLIGKDVWAVLFNKSADKIQAYKKGVYVLTDSNMGSYLSHLLLDNETKQKSNFTHHVLVLIVGIIKGILARFRMKGSVTYTLDYPTCRALEGERESPRRLAVRGALA
ncbi:transporter particle (TRAPP) component, Bet3 [Plasmodium vivax Brazil I]|uniref:Transporter particle (TRAPP) component, Bet3 n=1 Tax=Plasmodium vivax (strain Brazil I) TaxID=1033975 RepID=A0A0J9SRT8_PLAV1|nr:transporter particle (TRAPP) component, Bet3 [Plasmodium vivax Brazil I]